MGQTIKEKWFLIRNDLEFFLFHGNILGKSYVVVVDVVEFIFADPLFIPAKFFTIIVYFVVCLVGYYDYDYDVMNVLDGYEEHFSLNGFLMDRKIKLKIAHFMRIKI